MTRKIIITVSAVMLLVSSCKKDITELNTDPKNPESVSAFSLVTNAQRELARMVSSPNVNLNIFRLIVQYWQETTYVDESRYDIFTRNIPQGVWSAAYRDVLQDLEAAKELVLEQVTDITARGNQLAVIDILQVYTYYYLITTFGNIPYTEALNIEDVFPAYDDAATVYADLIDRLNTAIGAIDITAEGFSSADIIYGGNMEGWRRFANSFKLKMGITVADSNPELAGPAIESAVAAGIFDSNDDNAIFGFLSAPPNTNPVWEDLVQSGRRDFVAASTIVTKMDEINDPRLSLFFTVDAASDYSGGDPGSSSNYSTFSKPDEAISAPDYPGVLLDYAEVEFLLAEAVERGYSVGGTAAGHYDNAITASVEFWGGTAADATAYLANAQVSYTSAAGNYKQKIGIQKWIALYNRGWDAWIEWRRLDYPQLEPATGAISDIPVRFTYPVNEQNYNTANYNQAATAIGGDDVATKLFWDIY